MGLGGAFFGYSFFGVGLSFTFHFREISTIKYFTVRR